MQRLLLAGACLLNSCAAPERVTPLEQHEFDQIIVDPFRQLYPEYIARYRAVSLPTTTRPHFAGDLRLTASQSRLRWMLPVMYPSLVDDAHVFIRTPSGLHALDGLDEALMARLHALDETCAGYVERIAPGGACIQVAWLVADAGLRGDTERFKRACALARTQCPQ